MFFQPATFDVAVSFVNGVNSATAGGTLIGIREWLVVKANYGNNLAWSEVVRHLVDLKPCPHPAKQDVGEDHNIAALLQILEEFMLERDSQDGLRRIFIRYQKWLEHQEWYGPDSPQWIDC
jgi:hypothetical protein